MEVKKINVFIEESRTEFRELISRYLEGDHNLMRNFLKDKLDECCSTFEENLLKENLQEEFGLYLDQIKGE